MGGGGGGFCACSSQMRHSTCSVWRGDCMDMHGLCSGWRPSGEGLQAPPSAADRRASPGSSRVRMAGVGLPPASNIASCKSKRMLGNGEGRKGGGQRTTRALRFCLAGVRSAPRLLHSTLSLRVFGATGSGPPRIIGNQTGGMTLSILFPRVLKQPGRRGQGKGRGTGGGGGGLTEACLTACCALVRQAGSLGRRRGWGS